MQGANNFDKMIENTIKGSKKGSGGFNSMKFGGVGSFDSTLDSLKKGMNLHSDIKFNVGLPKKNGMSGMFVGNTGFGMGFGASNNRIFKDVFSRNALDEQVESAENKDSDGAVQDVEPKIEMTVEPASSKLKVYENRFSSESSELPMYDSVQSEPKLKFDVVGVETRSDKRSAPLGGVFGIVEGVSKAKDAVVGFGQKHVLGMKPEEIDAQKKNQEDVQKARAAEKESERRVLYKAEKDIRLAAKVKKLENKYQAPINRKEIEEEAKRFVLQQFSRSRARGGINKRLDTMYAKLSQQDWANAHPLGAVFGSASGIASLSSLSGNPYSQGEGLYRMSDIGNTGSGLSMMSGTGGSGLGLAMMAGLGSTMSSDEQALQMMKQQPSQLQQFDQPLAQVQMPAISVAPVPQQAPRQYSAPRQAPAYSRQPAPEGMVQSPYSRRPVTYVRGPYRKNRPQ